MPRRYRLRSLLVVAVLLALLPAAALSQTDTKGSRADGEKAWNTHRRNIDALLKGEQPEKADEAAAADAFAQWYVYRMTWTETHNDPKILRAVASEFVQHMSTAAFGQNAEKNREFVKILNARLAAAFKEVFTLKASGNHITITNTALLLPSYAKLRLDPTADFLAGLVGGKEYHDVVRFGAVKGLREFFFSPLPRRMEEKAKARDARLVNAVLDYVTRTWEVDAEIKEEVEAARFMRREGIRTLAAIQLPAVDVTAEGKVAGPVAHGLARVLAGGKNALTPPPSLSEKLEAAIGICQLRSDIMPEYQPEAALRLVGEFLVELTTEYIKDYPQFATKDKDLRKIPLLPWKSAAVRLEQGLQTLASTLPAKVLAQENAKNIQEAAGSILRNIKGHLLQDQPTNLRRAVANMKVPDPSLYKGAKGYEVELPGIGE